MSDSNTSAIEAVHVVQRMAPGGIETLVLDLVRTGGDGHRIISLDGTTAELIAGWPLLASIADRVVGLDRGTGFSPLLSLRLGRRLRQMRPRAVVLHHVGPLLYGATAARLVGIKRIIHVEHDVWHYAAPRRRQLTRYIEALCRPHHIAVSVDSARTLKQILPKASITVIPNGIELDRFVPQARADARAAFGLPAGVTLIGTVGRLVSVKGHADLITAMSYLPDNISLVIAGDGAERAALERQAKTTGVANRIRFLGHVDEVERLLPAFDVFCLPSHSEGFPRSVIEAQACNIPVVATDVGALREAICPKSGRLSPARDPFALAEAMREVLASNSRTSPRRFIEARYSWSNTVAAYARVMEISHAA